MITLETPNNVIKKPAYFQPTRRPRKENKQLFFFFFALRMKKKPSENRIRNSQMLSNYNIHIFSKDVIWYEFAWFSLPLFSSLFKHCTIFDWSSPVSCCGKSDKCVHTVVSNPEVIFVIVYPFIIAVQVSLSLSLYFKSTVTHSSFYQQCYLK